MKPIYLDHNATTPCAPEVIDAMLPFLGEDFGNASSPHLMGRRAAKAVEKAREQVADLAGCDASEIVFTGGATESNNLVLVGISSEDRQRSTVVTSTVEHKSVLGPCERLAETGRTVLQIPVSGECLVDLGAAEALICESTLLVSVQAANNEVGTIQPVKEVAHLAREKGAHSHCDAAQALGKIPFNVRDLGVETASFSAHKLYGPKGVGVLYIRGGTLPIGVTAPFAGGDQERGIRPGTLNVPGIVGMGEACRLAKAQLARGEATRLCGLRDHFENLVVQFAPGAAVNGCRNCRLPGTTNIAVPGIPADVLIANLPRVCFSSGSACNSGSPTPSHVLLAMGCSREQASHAVRFAVGRYNSREEIEEAARLIRDVVVSHPRGMF